MRKAFPILYRTAAIICAAAGMYLSMYKTGSGSFMGAGTAMNFYTLQSNFWALCVFVLFLVLSIISLKKGAGVVKRWQLVLKYVIAVAITVTLLVFWTMLAPTMTASYLATPSNLLVHTLTPLLMISDLMLFDREHELKQWDIAFVTVPPLYYLAFALLRARLVGTELYGGSRYPYWFMDIDKFGWFGNENGIGVFWWIIVIVALVLLLGWGFFAIRRGVCKRFSDRPPVEAR